MGIVTDTDNKRDLRRRMRAKRIRLAHEIPDAAERAVEHLAAHRLPAFASFAGYYALGAELNPSPLIRHLAAMGAFFALPVCEGPDRPLLFRMWESRDRLIPDALGVPSPPPWAQRMHPDLVIAPVLAFDRKGGRLGQGGGHYDRTLQGLRANKKVFVLGLAYAGQELPEVPSEPHDQRLDAILTETGYIEVEKT
jgi:5-formyltetrahydrofolate cyclo-ligase